MGIFKKIIEKFLRGLYLVFWSSLVVFLLYPFLKPDLAFVVRFYQSCEMNQSVQEIKPGLEKEKESAGQRKFQHEGREKKIAENSGAVRHNNLFWIVLLILIWGTMNMKIAASEQAVRNLKEKMSNMSCRNLSQSISPVNSERLPYQKESSNTFQQNMPKPIAPKKSKDISILSPENLLQEIVESARRYPCSHFLPEIPEYPWRLGVATNIGKMYSSNQDYGFCFEIRGYQVLILADGLGGTPYGAEASFLTVKSAARSIVYSYSTQLSCNFQKPCHAAEIAVRDAYYILSRVGQSMNIKLEKEGLRTTLIIIIANREEYGYAYIGDGGAFVLRGSQEVDSFLVPQKGEVQNVLNASFGPKIAGAPVVGSIPRKKDDLLLLAGTDGVFDYVNPTFHMDVCKAAMKYKGDLKATAEYVLKELAEIRNDKGFLHFQDNLTLGLIGNAPQQSTTHSDTISSISEKSEPHSKPIVENEEKDHEAR